jgi:hypothetical protein
VVAPYVDLTGDNTAALQGALSSTALRAFTGAFVVGKGCTPTWGQNRPVATYAPPAQLIANARAAGADVILSFGGAAGKELATTCTQAKQLQKAYQAVIDRLSLTKVDFDVEGKAIGNTAANQRRAKAIKGLQAANPGLQVSLTLPVDPSGLPREALAVVKAAKAAGARIDVVNVMAMDYGPAMDLGAAARTAAAGTLAQLQAAWPTARFTYANIGITPMIGQNDSPAEVFTYDDAVAVRSFAAANGVGRLAFWSLNRDRQCPTAPPPGAAQDDCSGLTQDPFSYTNAFLGD